MPKPVEMTPIEETSAQWVAPATNEQQAMNDMLGTPEDCGEGEWTVSPMDEKTVSQISAKLQMFLYTAEMHI